MTKFLPPRPARIVILAALLIAVVAIILVVLTEGGGKGVPESPYPVQAFEDQGREHLMIGETYEPYNSNPPTSGPHAPRPADWGVHTVPVAKEALVHNMEHAGVVVWYNCAAGPEPLAEDACAGLQQSLARIVEGAVSDGKLVVMSPYAGMEHRIALTAWRYLDAFDQFDEARVVSFIDIFERHFNPEGF